MPVVLIPADTMLSKQKIGRYRHTCTIMYHIPYLHPLATPKTGGPTAKQYCSLYLHHDCTEIDGSSCKFLHCYVLEMKMGSIDNRLHIVCGGIRYLPRDSVPRFWSTKDQLRMMLRIACDINLELVLRAIFGKHLYQLLRAIFGAPEQVTVPTWTSSSHTKGYEIT